jgi:predicted DNA-binding transcriptional regulator YafY
MLLLSRKRLSGQELAERFEVSLRTIYRDLETINSAGVPVVSYAGADGGYELMENYHIDRQMVTLDELKSIVMALRGMQSTLNDRDMDNLLIKVSALVSKSEQSRSEVEGETLIYDVNPRRSGAAEKATLSELRLAARNRNVVHFSYTNAEGIGADRSVEPVGLALKGFAWYLYAYCRLRHDYRTFRLTRIKALRIEKEVFQHRGVRLEELDARWASREYGEFEPVILHFRSSAQVRVEEYFDTEQISELKDGSIMVKANHPENAWFISFLLSFGDDVKVLEPKQLADHIMQQAKRICALYE